MKKGELIHVSQYTERRTILIKLSGT